MTMGGRGSTHVLHSVVIKAIDHASSGERSFVPIRAISDGQSSLFLTLDGHVRANGDMTM